MGAMAHASRPATNPQPDRTACADGHAHCLCVELQRRRAYDAVRARKGLVALYRPPSMR
jgi:hypothetical protein